MGPAGQQPAGPRVSLPTRWPQTAGQPGIFVGAETAGQDEQIKNTQTKTEGNIQTPEENRLAEFLVGAAGRSDVTGELALVPVTKPLFELGPRAARMDTLYIIVGPHTEED